MRLKFSALRCLLLQQLFLIHKLLMLSRDNCWQLGSLGKVKPSIAYTQHRKHQEGELDNK